MNLVWLRNDLRLDDNPALANACQQGHQVQVIYTACAQQWEEHHEAGVKISFWQQALIDCQLKLSQLGIPLIIIRCSTFQSLPEQLIKHCQRYKVTDIHFNDEYAVNEMKRDESVVRELSNVNIRCHRYQADLLVTDPLFNQQGLPYRVFTPWYRSWIKKLSGIALTPLGRPQPVDQPLSGKLGSIAIRKDANFREDLFPATEQEASNRLQKFMTQRLAHYQEQRDIPSLNATSTLSPYLSSGLISARRCVYEVQQFSLLHELDWRADPWIRQLGWREFYRYLMIHFPRLSMNRAFLVKTESITWESNEAHTLAWQQGMTGFPIIDAGMRQMARTGWMHNRLRMLCASFYTKLMLSDWREGERFFMRSLIDGDFASNNGGWQWCASTGCDASPWFRIFNPTTQSQKFDTDGSFIRKMVPELKDLDNRSIHAPTPDLRSKYDYPEPILDYSVSRQRALDRFKSALK